MPIARLHHKFIRNACACLLLVLAVIQPGRADEWVWAPAHPVGSTLPAFELPDHRGLVHSLDGLHGERGLLLLFNRSTDW